MGEAAAEKDFYWKLFKSTFIISAFTIGRWFCNHSAVEGQIC